MKLAVIVDGGGGNKYTKLGGREVFIKFGVRPSNRCVSKNVVAGGEYHQQ